MFLLIILVFILYNYSGLELLVYVDWVLLTLGLILFFLAGYKFRSKCGAPKGKSVVHTRVLVDSGIYAVVQHPQYLCFIMLVLAFVSVSQNWFSVISGVTSSVLFYLYVLKEEQADIEKFGDALQTVYEKGAKNESLAESHTPTASVERENEKSINKRLFYKS